MLGTKGTGVVTCCCGSACELGSRAWWSLLELRQWAEDVCAGAERATDMGQQRLRRGGPICDDRPTLGPAVGWASPDLVGMPGVT